MCARRAPLLSSPPSLTLHPALLASFASFVAAITIVGALLLTQFYPGRFRIHPYPYLSDAGLRDPERIVLTIGLCLSANLLLPLIGAVYLHFSETAPPAFVPTFPSRLPTPHTVTQLNLRSGLALALFLTLFSSVPGYWFLHHVLAALFALSAATWSLTTALLIHAVYRRPPHLAYVCSAIQVAVIALFSCLWISLRLRFPFALIPNKDPRFVYMAVLEYVGTTAFLLSARLATRCARPFHLSLQLHRNRTAHEDSRTRPKSVSVIRP